ncbi:uridine diphosphate-N-acetylglucosamine-binding protein YvcK [Demequina sp. NBRC 110055]|uniref:gluconeogenesis factor YvcK family protein n=1 Tax=Demequina sp. NBRC 110055 TaxID=1570344 RepID=UPI00190E634C|nr:uridine diphosphate-N-acetylglucosamine-binding protein YvcK [Demequina sp. NBRC 110055]
MSLAVVALGGGHGLYHSLTALRGFTDDLTAVVTVADDGGSSGRLRAEMGIVPPGDLRMALSALCGDSAWGTTWRDVLQWRFTTEGPLDGHALGNLLIAALWDRSGDVVEGLDWVARLLQAHGRVLPVSEEPLTVRAEVETARGIEVVRGQVAVATAAGRVRSLALEPATPRVPDATLQAIRKADAVVLGPGSWYTSVLTHFCVAPVAAALVVAGPKATVILNVGDEDVETEGMSRVDDIRALRAATPEFRPAQVVVDVTHADDPGLREEVAAWGARLVVADVRDPYQAHAHDPQRLRETLRSLLASERPGGLASAR